MRPPIPPFSPYELNQLDIMDHEGRCIAHAAFPVEREELVRLLNAGAAPAPEPKPEPSYTWALVEIMGHRKRAGRTSEQALAGRPMLRVDIPGNADTEWVTEFYSPQSIFSFHPCSEQVARHAAKQWGVPVHLLAPGVEDEVADDADLVDDDPTPDDPDDGPPDSPGPADDEDIPW